MVRGDSELSAFYVYDRRSRVWFWVDFEDEKFGGYNGSDFERLERGRFIWPKAASCTVSLTQAQLLLEGIDWRPVRSYAPQMAV